MYLKPSDALAVSSSDKEREGAHRYGRFYDDLFDIQSLKQDRKLRILEIGVSAFGGGSLEAWQSLESIEEVVAIDKDAFQGSLGEKATFYQIDAYKSETIQLLKENHTPFDIIIDDGSHKTEDQTFFLRNYVQLLSDDGQLICEDVSDDAFFRQMCGEEGVYGIDLSANRPEKKATDTHNDRILVADAPTELSPDVERPTEQPKIFVAPKIREGHAVHMFGVPYGNGKTIPTCAFDQRLWKSGKMWTDLGYHVTYYGHKDASVPSTVHVPVTNDSDLITSYDRADYNYVPDHKIDDHAFKTFSQKHRSRTP